MQRYRQPALQWRYLSSLVGFVLGLPLAQISNPAIAQTQWFATTEPRTPADEQPLLHVPPGFAVELVVSEPDIAKPLNMNFDQRGRLWVTSTVEYPIPAPPDREPRDTIKILEDSDRDGTFGKVTTFADGLNIPIGVLPIDVAGTNGERLQAAIVHSIPSIYLLVDEDGDGKADRREILYNKFGSDDTHGMTGSFTWGFDGWVYAHHGFANTSKISAANGSRIQMQSGNTYRFRTDGTHVEQHTWGQVNPFGLCFDPLGNLYSADCHSRPAYLLLRGGYYPSFGKPHDGLGFAPELMTHDHGSTAICGITHYATNQFPEEYRGSLFIGNVVTNRINHDKLARAGSTYTAIEQPDFVTSDDPWFRPVDIKLGPDGALYVADFYNRVIAHVEVPLDHPGRDRQRGRIWRIFWKGTNGEHKLPPIPDFTRMELQELVSHLAHSNLTVRMLVSNELVLRDNDNVRASLLRVLDQSSNPFTQLHAMWVLERLGILEDERLLKLTADGDASVRTHAVRVLSERKAWPENLASQARAGLRDDDGFVQRAAADALGRHPSPDNLRALLDARQEVPNSDPLLLHTVRMALRDQLRPVEMWQEVTDSLAEADARAVADVALGIQSAEAADYLLQYLKKYAEPPDVTVRNVHHVARNGRREPTPELLAFIRSRGDTMHRASLLRAMVQAAQERGDRLSEEARKYVESQLHELLFAEEPELLALGIDLADLLKVSSAQERLTLLAQRRDVPEALRKSAMSALVSIDPQNHVSLLGSLLVDPNELPAIRDHAAVMLSAMSHPDSRGPLLAALPAAPARLQASIAAGLAANRHGAELLLQAVAAGKASARLLQQREVEFRLERSALPKLKERIAILTAGLPPEDERLQQLIDQHHKDFAAATPDFAAGAKVFAKHCGICHQVANQGAKIGPQLDGIGARGFDRLLEDLIDPSRNVDQAFRTTILVHSDGGSITGHVLREEGQIIVLADQQGKEVRVSNDEVEEREISPLSLMPDNVVKEIPVAEFHNLLGYLLSLKAKEAVP